MALLRTEQGIRKLLIGSTGVTNYVSQRVALSKAPQNWKYPFIVIRRISTDPTHHFGGRTGHVQRRVGVDIYGTDEDQVVTIGEQVRYVLDGSKSTATIGANSLTFQMSLLENEVLDVMTAAQQGGVDEYELAQDYKVGHLESTA